MKKKLMACAAFLLPTLALTGCGSQFGDKMVRAGMNTLMGMGTVFVVLIFIAFLISRFKYISQLENWFRNRKTKNEQAVTETVAEEPAADEEEIDETDDLALVAVITAALAASLETSPDKLIVRSNSKKKYEPLVGGQVIMKNYIVTVNGVSYEVSVEEVGEGSGSSACSRSQ